MYSEPYSAQVYEFTNLNGNSIDVLENSDSNSKYLTLRLHTELPLSLTGTKTVDIDPDPYSDSHTEVPK